MEINWNKERFIYWQPEDELPEMSQETYDLMFPLSKLDGIRLFPCLVTNDKKMYLISLEE